MADYYFNGDGGDGDMDNVANWYLDEDLATPALGVPMSSDLAHFRGNVWSGVCNAPAELSGSTSYIGGGTFNAAVSLTNGSSISGGTFNAAVSLTNGSSISGGTFNAAVSLTNVSYIGGGTFNASVVIDDYNLYFATINGRLSFDDGYTWLYSPNSPAVAPASAVKQGVSNLGVAGTLNVPRRRVMMVG